MAFAKDFESGWFAVTNPGLDIGFGFSFPTDPFESPWYWQAFGGYRESPYYNRNYTAGLEPTTAYPGDNIPDGQRETGTLKHLNAGETANATFAATTYRGLDRVENVTTDGSVGGE